MSDRTRHIISAYLESLHELIDTFQPTIRDCSSGEPALVERTALASMLHAFYQGVETLFTRVSADVDRVLPGGDQWHHKLLDSMSKETPRRTAVITEGLRQELSEYLGFRHLFRNISPLDLEWQRMASLVARIEVTLGRLESEVDAFFENNRING